jgi:hypothetical protein
VYGLSERAADRLGLLFNERPGGSGPSGRGSGSGRIQMVKCLSATAAGSTGVLSECYPAQIVSPAGDKKLPAETGGLVLLTLIGSDGNPAAPVANQTYLCVVAGDAAGDESGSGSAVITGRPRAVGIAPTASMGASPVYGESSLSIYTILANSTWEDTSLSVSLPSAGTYSLECTATVRAGVSTIGATSYIAARLWDVTNSVEVNPADPFAFLAQPQTTASFVRTTTTFGIYHTAAAPKTIRLEVFRGPNFTTSIIDGTTNSSITRLRYRKLD